RGSHAAAWSSPSPEIPSARRNRARPRSFRGVSVFFGNVALPARLHERAHIGEQLLGIVDDAVLDGVFQAAMPLDGVGRVVETHCAGTIQELEIGQRIMLVHEQVGAHADVDGTDLVLDAAEGCALRSRGTNHFQRMEAGLLQQLELPDIAETEDLVDEAGITAGADASAAILVFVDK